MGESSKLAAEKAEPDVRGNRMYDAKASGAGRMWAGAKSYGHTPGPGDEEALGRAVFNVDAGERGLSPQQFAG
jgi:sugar lactone lactonase YvrE